MDKRKSLTKRFSEANFRSPFGSFKGESVLSFLKTFSSIIKAIISRSLYSIYTLVAVWRVAEALNDPNYWLLLFTLLLIAIEMIHTVLARKGGEMKWVTPSVFFYLVCAVPPIWLMEIKLLNDRLGTPINGTSGDGNATTTNLINISITLSDSSWTLALEQILIFVLIFGKWIAPKGELSRDELSQLLLVYLGAGADIIELLEIFAEDEVSGNTEIVYLIMSVWSWSLLQFCIVPTAVKNLPTIHNDEALDPKKSRSVGSASTIMTSASVDVKSTPRKLRNSIAPAPARPKPKAPFQRSFSEGNQDHKKIVNGGDIKRTKSSGNNLGKKMKVIEVEPLPELPSQEDMKQENGKKNEEVKKDTPETVKKNSQVTNNGFSDSVIIIDDYYAGDKEADPVYVLTSGKTCCVCFCCYTEIWGMILSMMFQDVPFLITRLFIMIHYKVISHMTVFFTCKNILIIILLLNRIRVIVLEERKGWLDHMAIVKEQRIKKSPYLQDKQKLKERKKLKSKDETNAFIKQDDNDDVLNENNKAKPNNTHRKTLKSTKWKFWRT